MTDPATCAARHSVATRDQRWREHCVAGSTPRRAKQTRTAPTACADASASRFRSARTRLTASANLVPLPIRGRPLLHNTRLRRGDGGSPGESPSCVGTGVCVALAHGRKCAFVDRGRTGTSDMAQAARTINANAAPEPRRNKAPPAAGRSIPGLSAGVRTAAGARRVGEAAQTNEGQRDDDFPVVISYEPNRKSRSRMPRSAARGSAQTLLPGWVGGRWRGHTSCAPSFTGLRRH